MKFLAISLLAPALLLGQEPVKVTPGTPAVNEPAPAHAQTAPAGPIAPDTVVATVGGKPVTKAELDQLLGGLPVQIQEALQRQPQQLSQLFLMKRLSEDAVKDGVDKQSPFKEQLEFNRLQVLSTAELTNTNNSIKVSEEDKQKYYQEHPDKFKEVKVKVIYVAFNPTPGKTPPGGKPLPTEAEAQAKVMKLRIQVLGGLDFGKVARDNSDDAASAAKDGDFGVIKQNSAYPEQIKKAVFELKQGEVSAPIKEPNGFYLIRAEEISTEPFDDVVIPILQDIRRERFQAWLKGMQSQFTVKVENPDYFKPQVPAKLQQVR
ncbi:MAG TPA: peptidylprolyl isomerase [Bryobacteraceae bacterium]|nr:peptidylprolyl isomerase [Bryobacteraceae bacterium]HUO31152.1 peptidylprolyl isomerase [Bryobacteraceae bacterium]